MNDNNYRLRTVSVQYAHTSGLRRHKVLRRSSLLLYEQEHSRFVQPKLGIIRSVEVTLRRYTILYRTKQCRETMSLYLHHDSDPGIPVHKNNWTALQYLPK